jgi:hypothetical protein
MSFEFIAAHAPTTGGWELKIQNQELKTLSGELIGM